MKGEYIPTCSGRFSKHITVLRDTDCNGVVVWKNLISEVALTGKHRICVLADGS